MMARRQRQITIHGLTIAYHCAGSGPVVLMLHGMAGDSYTWDRVFPVLSRRFTVVAPDLLGHGNSATPATEYSLGAHTNILRDFLLALGHERATLVGHSYGGGVAMQLAYQFPGLCERIVLVGSGGLGPEVNRLLRVLALPGAEQLFPLLCSHKLCEIGRNLASWLGAAGLRVSPEIEQIWRSYESLSDAARRAAFFRTLRAVIDSRGQSISARDRFYLTAQVPMLIVWGSHDAIIPVEHAHQTHESLAGSRLDVFESAGHYPHCESPERFAAALSDFIDSTAEARNSQSNYMRLLRTTAGTSHA